MTTGDTANIGDAVNAGNTVNTWDARKTDSLTADQARAAVLGHLAAHGHPLTASQRDAALVGLGVNSVALVQVLASLEDEFDLDFDTERLFADSVSVAVLEAELLRLAGAGA